MRRIAVIPARGGSKRLPRKNIAPFLGKPMIAYSIEAALQTALFDDVLVSTEDDEIAAVAEGHGATIHQRDPSLATDNVGVSQVLLDILKSYRSSGKVFDLVCCLFPTAPLRDSEDIKAVVSLVEPGRSDFAMAVTSFPYPPWQALKEETDGSYSSLWPELMDKKSQEFGELLVDNGSTYAVSVEAFMRLETLNGPNIRAHIMDRFRSVDIDTAEDLRQALLFGKELNIYSNLPEEEKT